MAAACRGGGHEAAGACAFEWEGRLEGSDWGESLKGIAEPKSS